MDFSTTVVTELGEALASLCFLAFVSMWKERNQLAFECRRIAINRQDVKINVDLDREL